MEIKLNYPKEEFRKELENYIKEGESFLEKEPIFITSSILANTERNFNLWNDEVIGFLNIRMDSIFGDNIYLKKFKNTSFTQNIKDLSKALTGQKVTSIQSKYQSLVENCQEKINILTSLKRNLKFIEVNNIYNEIDTIQTSTMKSNKIFISHSNIDSNYVEKIIDVLEIIGVPSENIFCSSFEGYGVKLGDDFLNKIKEELNNQVLVLFILSKNFYSSPISLCEMGATWVKTNKHIPILIPPFDYTDVKGVIPTTHGMKIDEREKYNTLKEVLESFLELKPIKTSVWERKRNNILRDINELLSSVKNEIVINEEYSESHYNINLKIKTMSKFEIKTDKSGQFRFNLKAGNGQTILASEAYTTKAACNNGIESVKTNSQDDNKYDRLTAKDGSPYFNLKAANGQIIGTSEMYSSNDAMENGIASVKNNAPNANVEDDS